MALAFGGYPFEGQRPEKSGEPTRQPKWLEQRALCAQELLVPELLQLQSALLSREVFEIIREILENR